jgi:hypothetical protein
MFPLGAHDPRSVAAKTSMSTIKDMGRPPRPEPDHQMEGHWGGRPQYAPRSWAWSLGQTGAAAQNKTLSRNGVEPTGASDTRGRKWQAWYPWFVWAPSPLEVREPVVHGFDGEAALAAAARPAWPGFTKMCSTVSVTSASGESGANIGHMSEERTTRIVGMALGFIFLTVLILNAMS